MINQSLAWDWPNTAFLIAMITAAVHAYILALRTILAYLNEPARFMKRRWIRQYEPSPYGESPEGRCAWTRKNNLFSDAERDELTAAFTTALMDRFAKTP